MKYFDNLMEKNYHIQSYNAYRVTRNFAGVNICGLAIFCVLRELILATRTDWFFMLGINFCDFHKVLSTQH